MIDARVCSGLKFTVKRTLTQSAAAWVATKQNGCLTDLKQMIDENDRKGTGKQTALVIRIGGTSVSGEIHTTPLLDF